MERIEAATIAYLLEQIQAGAEVIKLFDSWAGSLKGADFDPLRAGTGGPDHRRIKGAAPRNSGHRLPREAGERYCGFATASGADCIALDTSVAQDWAADNVQAEVCVQGNLDPGLLVTGGLEMNQEVNASSRHFAAGRIFSTWAMASRPTRTPDNVARMIAAVRETA